MKILRLTLYNQAKPQMLRENLIAIHVPESNGKTLSYGDGDLGF
jgi:hypothetical protein